jgi:hypothetical protein
MPPEGSTQPPREILKRHYPILPLKLRQGHHINRIPRTSFQKRPIRPLAGTKLAPNAQKRINQNPPKRWVIRIRHPEHAIPHRTILHASRRPRAPSAHLVDHRHNVRLAFPLGGRPLGNRFVLLNLAVHITRYCRGIFNHGRSIEPPNSPTFSTRRSEKSTESRQSATHPENSPLPFEESARSTHHALFPLFSRQDQILRHPVSKRPVFPFVLDQVNDNILWPKAGILL